MRHLILCQLLLLTTSIHAYASLPKQCAACRRGRASPWPPPFPQVTPADPLLSPPPPPLASPLPPPSDNTTDNEPPSPPEDEGGISAGAIAGVALVGTAVVLAGGATAVRYGPGGVQQLVKVVNNATTSSTPATPSQTRGRQDNKTPVARTAKPAAKPQPAKPDRARIAVGKDVSLPSTSQQTRGRQNLKS